MNEYEVELIHEPSGAHMSFIMFSETKEDEIELAKEILNNGGSELMKNIKEALKK